MDIYPRVPGTGMEPVVNAVKDLRRQARALQRPDGTRLAELYAQVQIALANVATSVSTAFAALVASGFTSPGAIHAADLYTVNGPGFNITGGRVTCWLETATGRVAMATSSRRFKQDEVDVTDVDPMAIIGVKMKYWHYITEVRKRDDPDFEDYVGPDYHVALNFGPIAEDLHAAGLWMCVIYERDEGGSLKLDENGDPIPFAIHDALWGYLEHLAMQWVVGRLDDHEHRLTEAGL